MKIVAIVFLMLFMISCDSGEETYVNEAIDIMEIHSLRRDSIDRKVFRLNAINGIEKMHFIVNEALYRLKDNHSFLLIPESQNEIYSKKNVLPFVS